jgi:hypothetical protein
MQLPSLPNLAAAARTWAVESQQVARRNAMLAATECAQRRAERQDVDDYLAKRRPPRGPSRRPPTPPPTDTKVRVGRR